MDHGEGSWLVTPEGERYLDYTSGIGVTNTATRTRGSWRPIQAQAAKLLHGQQNIVYHEPGLRLYERLAGLLPGGPWRAFLSNSGAEAVEAAVKLARVATGRPVIIGFRYGVPRADRQRDGADRGEGRLPRRRSSRCRARSTTRPTRTATGRRAARTTRRPAPATGRSSSTCCSTSWSTRRRSPAIIVEPVIGEGGYLVPPPDFLPRLRELTARHGILLIADEVQTGFGRTGELFAVRHWDVEPDILVMAKGIASGLPLSGILARQDLMERFAPGTHGGTYGGNVVVLRRGPRDARRHRGRGAGRERARARRPVPGRASGAPGARIRRSATSAASG